MKRVLIEVCVDSIESAVEAQRGGADRVELCDNLVEGGTTPSYGAIRLARQRLRIGLHVMIRPRGGDFCYSKTEFEVMQRDVVQARRLGADGIVFGILKPDGTIDSRRTGLLSELAGDMSVTFHRAFDMTRDPVRALRALICLKIDRVLTSGQRSTTLEGVPLIRELQKQAKGRIIIMPGGGVERFVRKLVRTTGVNEVHVTGTVRRQSHMTFRNRKIRMGGTAVPGEYTRLLTDANRIRAIRTMLSSTEKKQ